MSRSLLGFACRPITRAADVTGVSGFTSQQTTLVADHRRPNGLHPQARLGQNLARTFNRSAAILLPYSPRTTGLLDTRTLSRPPSLVPAQLAPPTSVLSGHVRTFHSTPPRSLVPWPAVLAIFKTSTAVQIAGTVSRIALTFMPVVFLRSVRGRKYLQHIDAKISRGRTDLSDKRERVVKHVRNSTIAFHVLLFTPVLFFWVMILASLERTPLTGRWRLILLSPEEEEDIASQLAGVGWYQAVGEILSQKGPPKIIEPSDWRLGWVRDTLRHLEGVIHILQHERELLPDWMEDAPSHIPQPPPADYPLHPRPRASEYIRRFAEAACSRTVPDAPHGVPGPPYSLLVVDEPESSNAFSYGFGPDGGGGIVVFSGFLNEILAKHPNPPPPAPAADEGQRSWWSSLWGSLFGSFSSVAPRSQPTHPIPTEEQTTELAILLAHELAHLVLAHHIETLSSGSILGPGVMSIFTDLVRTLLFPVTMLFGPFINDALASVGKASSGEFARLTEYCTSQAQEIEADIVSARLLAHAGFDPRHAVHFWENRHETPQNAECSPASAEQRAQAGQELYLSVPRRWMGTAHPMNVERVLRLKEELDRWEIARVKAREQRRKERERASVEEE